MTKARPLSALLMLGVAAASAAVAQDQPGNSASVLNLPANPIVFGGAMPSVVKATAIVNGEIITQTDIDQRLALLAIANGGKIPADEAERLRQQVLRNLIDETLQIQAAKAAEINVTDADIDKTVARVAANVKQTPEQMADYLKANGSSIRSIRRQILGEISWRRIQSAKIESGISVGDEEVKAVIQRLEASKGTEEYRVGEIFLTITPGNEATVKANANRIVEQLRQGASFVGYARQYSEASTAAVGGDLGWVRPEQLPEQLSAAVRSLQPGQVAIAPVQGGVSIVAVQDKRKVLTADPRNAELSLKQISVGFPAGTTQADCRADCRPLRPGSPDHQRLRRRRADGRPVQRRGGPIGWCQATRTAAGAPGDDVADAGRPGDPALRLAAGRRPRAGDLRPRRSRPQHPHL
jgi:peptidyl-prolyl cis-trans isomerase SurA